MWILLLHHIYDAAIVTRHCRDEMKVEVQFHPGPFSRCWMKKQMLILIQGLAKSHQYTTEYFLFICGFVIRFVHELWMNDWNDRDELKLKAEFFMSTFFEKMSVDDEFSLAVQRQRKRIWTTNFLQIMLSIVNKIVWVLVLMYCLFCLIWKRLIENEIDFSWFYGRIT